MLLNCSLKGYTAVYQSTCSATTLVAVTVAIICLLALTKWYFSGGVCKSKARLDGEKINITFEFLL